MEEHARVESTNTDLPVVAGKQRGGLKRLGRLLAIIVLTYVVVCAVIYLYQDRLMYFPSAEVHSTPADLRLAYEDVTLTTADGLELAGWYVPAVPERATVLFCHGNAGNIADRLVTIHTLHLLGYSVLVFDYRGYGRSPGHPDEAGTYTDAEAAWRYLIEHRGVDPRRLVLCGRSLGGAVAIELATRHEPGCLVVESSFTSMAEMGAIHYPLLPARLLCRYRYESVAKVGRLRCPKLFLHATNDQLIPIEIGRALFAAAAEPKEFIETPGEHSTGGFTYTQQYATKFQEFVERALNAGAARTATADQAAMVGSRLE